MTPSLIVMVIFFVVLCAFLFPWWKRLRSDSKSWTEQWPQLVIVMILAIGLLYSLAMNWQGELKQRERPLIQHEWVLLPQIDSPQYGTFPETSFQVVLDSEALPIAFLPLVDGGVVLDPRSVARGAAEQVRTAVEERGTLRLLLRVENREVAEAEDVRVFFLVPGRIKGEPQLTVGVSKCGTEIREVSNGSTELLVTCDRLYGQKEIEIEIQLNMRDTPLFFNALISWLEDLDLSLDGFRIYEHMQTKRAFEQMFPNEESLGPCAGPVVIEVNPGWVMHDLEEQITVDVVYGKRGTSIDISGTRLGKLPQQPSRYPGPANVHGPADSCL